jgi:1A family penicillin-binding protein
VAAGGLAVVILVVAGLLVSMAAALPKPYELITRKQPVSTKIYDRNGVLLYKIYKTQNRSIVSLADIPKQVVNATLAIEDTSFYSHPGFSLRGIARAMRNNVGSSGLQGGSTITQQLVKNALLSSERTVWRKVKEFVLAVEVEYLFTKDEILTMYLNEVGYGGTAYGVAEAASYYFGKPVGNLTLAEAALLAGLPASPTTYSPFGSAPELAINRQHQVLKRMVEEGMITAEEAALAQAEELVFAQPITDIVAPHFVMYVKDLLVREYGEEVVDSGGLEVYTTLDASIQAIAEEAIRTELARLTHLGVGNGAAMVTDPATGEILALVGSVNYFDTAHDGQVTVPLRPRQPGSSIKPLTYALALEEGLLTATSIIDDAPVVYRTPGSPPYAPRNYDGRFHGKVTVRQALANSYNVPAVKTLAQVGVSNLVEFAQEMGITTWNDPSRFGLALTLGGGEVRMIDMAQAYGVFANQGKRVPIRAILRVEDYRGKVRWTNTCSGKDEEKADCAGEQVLSSGVAYIISDILADNQARSAAFGTRSVLAYTDHQVAVKTGTTNDLRDNWTFGYTSDVLVATWVGNNDNTSMSRVVSGITGASPIWRTIMDALLADQPLHVFSPGEDMVRVAVCPLTQTLSCEECPYPRYEYFVPGTEPVRRCTAEMIEAILAPEETDEENRDRLLPGRSTESEASEGRSNRGRN